jgi:predicted metal-binding membrane protein
MASTSVGAPLLTRERNIILAVLLILAAAAWGIVIWQSVSMNSGNMSMSGAMDMAPESPAMDGMGEMPAGQASASMDLTFGMQAPLFLAIWVAMMVAMMFPSAAPMILTFARVQANRGQRGQALVPTWLFVLTYIGLWSATGILAFVGATVVERLAAGLPWLVENGARIGGTMLILAGLYQLSPLKTTCLSKCRTPTSFILSAWKEGQGGALRMGLEHGLYCLGCCWLLFVILFPLGMMNVAVLAVVALVIFAEKTLAIGHVVARVAASALIVYGAVVIVLPSALPTMLS